MLHAHIQAGFGYRYAVGSAFHRDEGVVGEVLGILTKTSLITLVIHYGHPEHARRVPSKHVIEVDEYWIARQMVVDATHATVGKSHGINGGGLLHLFFHVAQYLFGGHAVEYAHETSPGQDFEVDLVTAGGQISATVIFVFSSHQGELRRVEFKVQFHFGVRGACSGRSG